MTVDGLGLSYPQQGWVVLDAIRDRGLTGSVMLGGSPAVCVFADQGDIYWAETVGAPSIGARLVDAGTITAVQLERGAVRHGGGERLERLFERVPAIDRDTVLVAVRALAEQSLVSIAGQMLAGVVVEPYIHHPSGLHLWNAQHPVARRNDVGRAAMWAAPDSAVTYPPVVSNVAPPVASVPEVPVEPVAPVAPVEHDRPTVSVAPEVPVAPVAPGAPEVPESVPTNVTAETGDFSLVWNELPTQPPSVDVGAEISEASSQAQRVATTEAPTGSTGPGAAMAGDEFEVKWPASPVAPLASRSRGADTLDESPVERSSTRLHVSEDERFQAWSPEVGGDVVHPDRRQPNESLTEALSDLIGLVDRDLAAVRDDVDDLDDAGPESLSSDGFIAVRRAIASADTGLLNARRRLIDHRLRDRSSRGSSTGSSDDPGTSSGPGGVDQLGVVDEPDDPDDGSPALRRFMGNLRRA